jgi:peroxiredoxin
MPALETIQIPLGFDAPSFSLIDTKDGIVKSLSQLKGKKATVFMFICNHCPYVKHLQTELVNVANEFLPQGIAFIAISSNDVENYPEDSPEKMKEEAIKFDYPFTYLYDETQEVAKAYQAACTPDFSIFDKDLKCVYRGQFDDSRPKNDKPITGKDLRAALNAILADQPIPSPQIPSIGCSIKWKK